VTGLDFSGSDVWVFIKKVRRVSGSSHVNLPDNFGFWGKANFGEVWHNLFMVETTP